MNLALKFICAVFMVLCFARINLTERVSEELMKSNLLLLESRLLLCSVYTSRGHGREREFPRGLARRIFEH
jgi:hypothetical protein